MEQTPFDMLMVRQKNMESILHSLQEGIIAHDLERKIFFFNRSAEGLTGYSPAEVLGRDCHEVFKPSLCGAECSFCDGCEKTLGHKRYPTIFLDRQGLRKEFDVRTIPLIDESGNHIGVVTSLIDRTEMKSLQRRLASEQEFWGIVGQDHKMQLIYDLVRDLGQSDFPVVISGESGTGKELVAHAIHSESSRRDRPFIAINCGALPEGTLESELFGHVRGAFTGAIRDKKGRFELADGGTLLLDEVSELTPAIQVKLLRVLQEGIIEPVGSEKSRPVNVRIISASNRNLKDLVKSDAFREDLYYRLAVVPIEIPPLRQRRNDIPLIAQHCLASILEKMGRPPLELSPEVLAVMVQYPWPGNVRELQNAIQYSIIKSRGGPIALECLPDEIHQGMLRPPLEEGAPQAETHIGRRSKLTETMVRQALLRTGGNKAKAARILGVGRATLYNFLQLNAELADIGASI
jgi:PAS domain S-box-containing protein